MRIFWERAVFGDLRDVERLADAVDMAPDKVRAEMGAFVEEVSGGFEKTQRDDVARREMESKLSSKSEELVKRGRGRD